MDTTSTPAETGGARLLAGSSDPAGVTVLYWLLRLGLGMLILATGVGKALDLPGFVGVLQTYRFGLDGAVLKLIAPAISAVEIALGLWILGGWRIGRAMWAAIALNAGYCVVLSSALWRGLDLANCGCFGVFLAEPLRWYSPLEDLGLIVLASMLLGLATARIDAEAATTIRAPSSKVAALYRDFGNWPRMFPTIRAAHLLRCDQADGTQVIEVQHRDEGRVVNLLRAGPAAAVELEESRRRYDARFVNRFGQAPEGTRYTVAADIRPKGWWKLLAGPWLSAWVRHRIRRDVLEPVRRFAEAGGATTGLPADG